MQPQPETFDTRLFWAVYWLYLASFLLFTVFGATRGRRVGRAATVVLTGGFVLHTVALAWRWWLSKHVPMANMYEYASLLAWMAVLSYLYIGFRYRKTIVGTFVAPVVVAVMTCASLLPKDITQQLMPALQSYWLWIHVSMAALGEGAFAVAFAVSVMYLVKELRQRRQLTTAGVEHRRVHASMRRKSRQKARVPVQAGTTVLDVDDELDDDDEVDESIERLMQVVGSGGDRDRSSDSRTVLPSLRLLDEINYRAVAIGYPLFTIGGLFAGAVWAYEAWGSFWSWDPKEVGALIIWFFYTAYLHARLQRSWSGRRAAWLSIAGFAIVILSFLGNLWLGGNHAYT
jgi:cytochrome c-type biogenesis protein CcsB